MICDEELSSTTCGDAGWHVVAQILDEGRMSQVKAASQSWSYASVGLVQR